ncbi:MAG TPA: RibD family protein [Pseudobacteroides sp.]|uniref:RibD family protein n=1 Tax=Pseudobacteroides sp. TaxID=1968840 RepID=UPI002F91D822
MLPHVVVHNAVSVDGRMDCFEADVGLYNFLALIWKPDVMLSSSNTILSWFDNELATETVKAEMEKIRSRTEKETQDRKQLLAVVDSRGKVKVWHKLLETNHWRDVVVLCSESTPKEYLQFLDDIQIKYLITGEEKVNFHQALERLASEYGAKVVRVDSGGTLNGILFREGLVNEVSVLIYPLLIGGETPRSIFCAKDLVSAEGVMKLKLIETRKVRENLIWIRYGLERKGEEAV